MHDFKDLKNLNKYEVGSSYLELIEFTLKRTLPSGERMVGTYGIDVGYVREVVHMPKINPLGSTVRGITGIFELRGVPIPAINLRMLLEDANPTIQLDQQIIVVEMDGRRAGFIVSSTRGIRRVLWDKVLPPSSDSESFMASMVLLEDKDFLFVLDLEGILNFLERGRGGSAPTKTPVEDLPPASGPTVLIVDDSKAVLSNLERLLSDNGFRSILAENGKSGLEILMESVKPDSMWGKIDMVITDIEMPVMNGLEFTTQLRKVKSLATIPVIVHTSINDDTVASAIQVAGASAFTQKNDNKKLLALLRKFNPSEAQAS
jgi:two-component system, chemotaxis family, chemotaxis protein CheV